MPKRNSQEKIEYYAAKIRRIEEKRGRHRRERRRVVIYSDSSNSDENSGRETPSNDVTNDAIASPSDSETPAAPQGEAAAPPPADAAPADATPADAPAPEPAPDNLPASTGTEDSVPVLDAEFLSALGDPVDEKPTYGAKIHQNLAQLWLPILRRGILKESKEKLLKEYAIPENCKLLRAPTLNPEISAAIAEQARARDKKIEGSQQQLGLGITAISRAMSLLFTGDDKQTKVQAIKVLSDGCRILCDLHHVETQARIKSITPALDKAFLNIIQDMERDESLFGSKLSDKIKASKTIEKQGLQIKKPVSNQKTSTSSTAQPTTRSRSQGNWTAPSRYQQSSNRGGRGGAQKMSSSAQKPTTTAPAQKNLNQNKQRAPPRQ